MKKLQRSLFCLFAMAITLSAQTPAIENANLSPRAVSGSLKSTIDSLIAASTEPVWIGYSVAMIPGDSSMCCFSGNGDGCCRGCSIEEGQNQGARRAGSTAGPQTVQLEASRELRVMLRAESGKLDKLRAFSSDCPLDAGGRTVHWLTGVNAQQSVEYLSQHVTASDWSKGPQRKTADSALTAIVHHAGARADSALKDFLSPGRPNELRKQTAFWLCSARGAAGLDLVRAAVRADADPAFRKEAMFALSVSSESGSADDLIHFARNDASAKVREQALFWLAQKAGRKATAMLTEAIDKDPETQVKKQAVFALSQLPKDEGIPLLIQIAKTHRNSEVRKQAMFWLGQSNDSRALSFFEEVLTK